MSEAAVGRGGRAEAYRAWGELESSGWAERRGDVWRCGELGRSVGEAEGSRYVRCLRITAYLFFVW